MMECNKEEAIRAKGLAEKKMEAKDFAGARKVALKAQQLFPGLENISHMLMVCDVHCSAEQKVNGKEMDWYGILKISPTVDEATIKKQYRKFALMLHPDKNKFAGAESAFKLIGEAHRVLSDKGKRSLHDVLRGSAVPSRPAVPYRPPQHGSSSTSFAAQNNFRTKTSYVPQHQREQPPPQPGFTSAQPTFWTVCPGCAVKYQYYKEVLGKYLKCQNCNKSFMAHDINVKGVPLVPNHGMPTFFQRKDVPNQGSKVEFKGTSGTQNVKGESIPKTRYTSDAGSKKSKRKYEIESSESFDTKSSNSETKEDDDHEVCSDRKPEFSGDQYVRRSNRQKQHVSYKENISDDEQASLPKKAKGSASNYAMEEEKAEDTSDKEESEMNNQAGSSANVKEHQKESVFVDSSSNGFEETKKGSGNRMEEGNDSRKGPEVHIDLESTPDVEVYTVPDPDFNDFDDIRKEECFECGQTWAIYDTVDAMPRFYAYIKKVYCPGFRLQIVWLEPVMPDDEIGKQWLKKDLPVSCGIFKQCGSDNTEDRLMFSHLVFCQRIGRGNSYKIKIYPRKGETWALFKNWSVSWATDPDSNPKYDYDIVEILSEYVEDNGLTVAYLGKLKGFVSLFYQMDKEGMRNSEIPPSEFYRFSHKVPSFKMSGEEREGVPKGSYELDPASLPITMEEIEVPVDLKVGVDNGHLNDSSSRSHIGNANPMAGFEGHASRSQDDAEEVCLDSNDSSPGNVNEDCRSPVASSPEAMEIPDPEFYNFDADKSPDKFKIGQVWALYGDEDGLPRYYGEVTRVDNSPDFKLHVAWLTAAQSLPKGIINLDQEDMLFGCGTFRVNKIVASQIYTSNGMFSHQLKVQHTGKRNEYVIFPREHEVWALYKNWNPNMTRSDLDSCEYEIVEVYQDNHVQIKVLVLERLSGYNSVFKAQSHGGSAVMLEITHAESLRFSHQIPAFRLLHERGGELRGCWELDPAALPMSFFSN